jgi:phosphate transport system protein
VLDEKVVLVIAQRQPMSRSDLREVVHRFDPDRLRSRAGRRSWQEHRQAGRRRFRTRLIPCNLVRGIDHLGDLALMQLKEVLDAFGSRSVTSINMIRDRDDEIDAMYTSLFRELLTYMMEDPRNITDLYPSCLFCAKNIERIGDHATNIAESVYYIVTGEQLSAEPAEG